MKYSHCCLTCGHLHSSGHAAELGHPAACQVCGKGVVFRHQDLAEELHRAIDKGDKEEAKRLASEIARCDPASKRLVPENWQDLSECSPEELVKLGLTPDDVEEHVPWTKDESVKRDPVHLTRTITDGVGVKDKAG